MSISPRTLSLSTAMAATLALSSCATPGSSAPDAGAHTNSPSSTAENTGGTADRQEVDAPAPRAVLTYDGGLMTVDTETGEVVGDIETEGFLRLNNAGDGRHVLISDGDEFRVFDSGLIAEGHGDHDHYYETLPALTGASIEAPEAAHVVAYEGKTALFADGTGGITVMDSTAFSDGKVTQDEIEEHATDAAHHGVAVPLSSGDLLLTQGTAESRNTVEVVSPEGDVVAETTDCPGVHGEATAQATNHGDVVTLGCENGPVIYRDGAFHKVPVEEQYQRSGNLFGNHGSPIVLADYKTDPDADQERPTRIGLIDTRAASMTTVDLGSPYWFRSLARGADGEALVLTYDGELNILDEETGKILHEVPVTAPWEEPEEWQSAAPAVKVGTDGFAYVTEPATKKLHVIDIAAGTLLDSFDLPETPVELAVLTGEAEAPDHEHENDHGQDHADGEDHAKSEEEGH
ncbi:hypothetical protein [Arthrobacter zhaoguopingii]|uniref:hypothetical protein n=1 Tax=Arthrobacter zhaoguopingii TaxID=2681491 RepID=UPI001357089F|nr:hypothetical protein [Arthrobacter zhaoguopingii]